MATSKLSNQVPFKVSTRLFCVQNIAVYPLNYDLWYLIKYSVLLQAIPRVCSVKNRCRVRQAVCVKLWLTWVIVEWVLCLKHRRARSRTGNLIKIICCRVIHFNIIFQPSYVLANPKRDQAGGQRSWLLAQWLLVQAQRQIWGSWSLVWSHHSETSVSFFFISRASTFDVLEWLRRSKKPSGSTGSRSGSQEKVPVCSTLPPLNTGAWSNAPSQPFVADPSMPPLPSPNTATQLEEARRRLEDVKGKTVSRQR